jgi:broad-specificity NMP kinase
MPSHIYINGCPGVGQLTVAKELEKLIPGSKVYRNQLLIDPLVGRPSPNYHIVRASLRHLILHTIAGSEDAIAKTWIFTDSRCINSIGRVAARDYQDAAAQCGVPFITIALSCNLEENLKRVANRGLHSESNTKLTDLETVRSLREEEVMFRFGGPNELVLDTTTISPAEAAQKILKHIGKVENRAKKPEWDRLRSISMYTP